MTRLLLRVLELQFALVFMPTLLIACGTFGFGFEYRSADVVLGFLVVLIPVYAVLRRVPLGKTAARAAMAFGAGAAIATYRPLHFAFWDERSLSLAIWVALLGLASLAVSVSAHRALHSLSSQSSAPQTNRSELGGALVVIAFIWLCAHEYPLIGFLFLGAIFALGAFVVADPPAPTKLPDQRRPAPEFARSATLGLFFASVAFGWTLWDFQQNPTWALRSALTFVTAALAARCASPLGVRAAPIGFAFAVGALLSTIALPSFVVHPGHAVAPGVAYGLLLQLSAERSVQQGRPQLTAVALPISLGLAFGLPFALNLTIAGARAALLLPWIALAFTRRRSAAPAHRGNS